MESVEPMVCGKGGGGGIGSRAASALSWLLTEGSPCVRYRALTEVLELPPDEREVQNAREAIDGDPQVVALFGKMHPDGYWLLRGKGAGVDYANGGSTHFIIYYLSELGLDRSDPRMARAVERYLDLGEADACGTQPWQIPPDFRNHQSCLYAYNLRSFIRAGYRDDPRVKERIQVLLDDSRWDGGYLCNRPSLRSTTKSCMRGCLKALSAFAELPELRDTPACKGLVDYFLRRHLFFRSDAVGTGPEGWVRPEFTSPRFPFTIYGSLLEVMYSISKLGYGNHPATQEGWEYLERWSEADGRCRLAHSPKVPFVAGAYDRPNEWATLYALLAWKYRGAGPK